MTQQHTQGLWEAMDSGLIYAPPVDGDDAPVLVCDVGEIDETTPERRADVLLIAAAPELLDALEAQAMADADPEASRRKGYDGRARELRKAALAKAGRMVW